MKFMDIKTIISIIGVLLCLTTVGVAGEELLGAGATFPYPLYSKMFDVYHREYGVKVNYQSIGSGGGQRQLINKTVDFGASDGFMTDEQLSKIKEEILHIPACLGAVVITFNLSHITELKFSQDLIADIYLGKITKWNDPKIQSLNPDKKLPDSNIIVVHRSDGSGTTFIFTDYLSKISSEWKEKVGRETSVNWPLGLGGKGNEGVAGLVKQIPGSIGYVELAYAIQNKMPVGIILNKKGNFIKPDLKSISLAGNVPLPDDTRVSITDTEAPQGYPISGFTWLLVYKEQNYGGRTKEKANALVNLLWWIIHEGQKYTEPLDYALLPPEAVKKAEAIIKSITYDSKPIMGK